MSDVPRSAAAVVGVEMVQWPADADRRDRLAAQGVPRLLLVPAHVRPPAIADDEDWIRVPVDERDVWARLERLGRIRARHGRRPVLGDGATLSYAGHTVRLTADEVALLRPLVDRFGFLVPWTDLVAALRPDGGGSAAAAVEPVRHLRARIAPAGLAIHAVARRGLVLDHPVPLDDTDGDDDAGFDDGFDDGGGGDG